MSQLTGVQNQQVQQHEEAHLLDYLNVIIRRRNTFLFGLLAVFLGVTLYTFSMKPVYEASATLNVKDDKAKSGVLGELSLLASNNPIDAEIEIIKSRTNAEQVVRQLHLDWQVTDQTSGFSFKITEFTSTVRDTGYRIEMTGPGSYTVSDSNRNIVGSGKSGVLLQAKGISLILSEFKGTSGNSCLLTMLPFNERVEKLRKRIKVNEVGRKTNVIRISYSDTNPRQAREVVNNLVQAYLDKTVALKSQEASRTVDFVEDQIKAVRLDLDKTETELQSYKSTSGIVKLDTEAEELIKKFSETEKDRAAVNIQKKQMEFALASLKDSSKKGVPYSPAATIGDPLMAGMATRMSELEIQKRSLLTEYTRDHPLVKAVQDQIEEMQRKIQYTYETSFKNLGRQESDIARRLNSYEGKLKQLPVAERELARLMRVAKVNADIFTFLLQKHEEARIAKASTISNINVVDPAIIPDKPLKPQKALNLLLGVLIGVLAGVGLAAFQEYLDDTIKDAEQAKRVVGLPLLAIIPFIQGRDQREQKGVARSGVLITQQEPKSQVAEAFRSLRTSLHFSSINRNKKIILLTSTFPGEGKSTISANLANTLAQTGAKVLIIDCDLRRSSLHEKFGINKIPGLAELLTGDTTFATACHKTDSGGLDLLTAGTTPPNPAELLGSENMRLFLQSYREKYDHIIIDAPPVLAVTDAPVLTAMADQVLVVMEAGRVPFKAAQRMREMLANINAPVTGLVVNDKTGSGEKYSYYGGRYGYGYGYGYGQGYYGDTDSVSGSRKTQWWKALFTKKTRSV